MNNPPKNLWPISSGDDVSDSRANRGRSAFAERMRFLALDRHKLNEKIAVLIQQLIAQGKLEPGSYLPPERKLAFMLGVNRATVREAIPLLCERGLIEKTDNHRPRVRVVEQSNIASIFYQFFHFNRCSYQELHEFRSMFEPEVAVFAATNAKSEDIQELSRLLLRLEQAWIDYDAQKLAELDARFHLQLAIASHNVLMQAIAHGLLVILEKSLRVTHASIHNEENFRIHWSIYRAIERHNPAEAGTAMRFQLHTQPVLHSINPQI